MKILCDRHHADLLYSLQKLFEDRLGFELYVTIGHEWWDEGYWRFGEVFGDDRLAQQYLNADAKYREVEPGLFLTFDACHPERPLYCVTLPWALEQEWDVVMATVQENQAGFKAFAMRVGAESFYHVGNARQGVDWDLDPFVLDASRSALKGRGIQISQEFDHETTFRYRQPQRMDRIVSFVNLLPRMPEQWEAFETLGRLTGYEMRSFGHDCPGGFLTPVAAVADEMARAGWAFQDKPTGDGFGHVLHNWSAVGRPLVGHSRFYAGQRGEIFWQDGLTCIDLDKHSIEAAAQLMLAMSPEGHARMCQNMRDALRWFYEPEGDAERLRAVLTENGRWDVRT